MILPGTLLQPTGETPESAQTINDVNSRLSGPSEGLLTFTAVLHDVPDDDPDDGLSTPDITQPLGMVHAQTMPIDAQDLRAESAGDRSGGSPPGRAGGASGQHSGEGVTLQSSGVAWPLGDRASAATEGSVTTPSDSMPQSVDHRLRPGIGVESGQSAATPISLEVERVELSIRVERATGSDARAMLAARTESAAPPRGEQAGPGIIRSMTSLAMQQGGAMRMRLDPPALGELNVQMTVTRGHVSMSIAATTVAGAEAFAGELHALRAGLEQRGFVIDRISVSGPRGVEEHMVQPDGDGQTTRDDADDAQDGRRRGSRHRRDEGEPTMDAILDTVLEIEQETRQ